MLFASALIGTVRTEATNKTRSSELRMATVSPTGWRRTLNGWELAESWGVPRRSDRSINQWISVQNQQEASFARAILDRLRLVHPLVYSTMLVVIVATIAMLHERTKRLHSYRLNS